ncbi:MAG: glycerophosphodiester phosphodiesterase [bacterium]
MTGRRRRPRPPAGLGRMGWLDASRCLVIAHRGASSAAPENTMAAFALAIDLGADGIELDVRRSREGQIVVIHDASVDRVTGTAGDISSMSLEQLRSLDAGARFDRRFAGERIPTLREVLSLARGRLLVDIELKVAGIEPQVVELVRAAGMHDSVLITSFLEDAVAASMSQGRGIPVGLLQETADLDRVSGLGVPVYLPSIGVLSNQIMHECRARGVRVIPWTVRSDADARRAVSSGVHGIIADDPALIRTALAGS